MHAISTGEFPIQFEGGREMDEKRNAEVQEDRREWEGDTGLGGGGILTSPSDPQHLALL